MGSRKGRVIRPLIERFWAKVQKEPNGCWRWLGHLDKAGYGRLHAAGRDSDVLYVHRFSYEMHRGPVPDGLHLDHLCSNKWCCNWEHLEPVTLRENITRAVGLLTVGFCKRGHPLDGDNLYFRKDRPGRWNCRQCRRERRSSSAT